MRLALLALVACGDDSVGRDAPGGAPQDGGGDASVGPGLDGPVCQQEPCDCPPAIDTRCGDPCSGAAIGCLCTCGGGGPDFTSCQCVSGEMECPAC